MFGLLLALLRLSKSRILRVPAALYTEIFKNIPLLAIIFIIYFGLASIGIKLGAIAAGSLSLILFYAAYLSGFPGPRSPGYTPDSRRRLRRSASGGSAPSSS